MTMTDDLTARCLAEIDRRIDAGWWMGSGNSERGYLAAFRAILAEHRPYAWNDDPNCGRCERKAWPCTTVRLIATALEIEPAEACGAGGFGHFCDLPVKHTGSHSDGSIKWAAGATALGIEP